MSVAPTLVDNYLLHQGFWQLSKSDSPGTDLVGNLEFFFEVEMKIAAHLFC